jgi:hypothetical protein
MIPRSILMDFSTSNVLIRATIAFWNILPVTLVQSLLTKYTQNVDTIELWAIFERTELL